MNGTAEATYRDPSEIFCQGSSLQACSRIAIATVHDFLYCIYYHRINCRQNHYLTKQKLEREIELEVSLAVLYLAILAALVGWSLHKMFHFLHRSRQQQNVCDQKTSEWPQPPPIDLSFLRISFYAKVNASSPSAFFRSSRSSRVLDQITGSFRAHQVSAIMGPSGSGKTTLLKLIGGRMYNGEFYGIRSINSEVFPASIYDRRMKSQGFVNQQDVLLPQLTIWQTIMFAALLRLPVKCELQEKLQR